MSLHTAPRGMAAKIVRKRAVGEFVLLCVVVSMFSFVCGTTDQDDVNALNTMYSGFNNAPQLTNWQQNQGDPCANQWKGVSCTGTSVTSLTISNLGLNGAIQGWVLQKLASCTTVDVSHNNLGGNLPGQFPPKATQLLFNNNQFNGSFPYLLTQVPSLVTLDLSSNQMSGPLNSQVFPALQNLVTLDLSYNNFNGSLPDTVGNMTSLQTLLVQNNKLTGTLPDSLALLTNLNDLDVSNNLFTGYLPPGVNPKTYNYGGNSISTQAPPPPPFTPPPRTPKRQPSGAGSGSGSSSSGFFTTPRIAGVAVAAILVIAAAGLAIWFFFIRNKPEKSMDETASQSSRGSWFMPLIPPGRDQAAKKSKAPKSPKSPKATKTTKVKAFEPAVLEERVLEEPQIKALPPVKKLKTPPSFKGDNLGLKKPTGKVDKSNIAATAFSVADLQAATNSFAQDNLIGEGALGRVFRADFPNGQVLAVKKLDTNASMVQNEDDFLGVVQGLARLQHTNTAELVGYCVEHDQRLLVYEYVSRGTLNELLHASSDNTKGLSWNVRVKIALGAARALEYLHEVCAPPVVHRNFKSANILLDDELNPHISDCGLAALTPSGSERQVSAQMLGSFGYSAPEYAMSGTYTVKSDVYSFGVVMLELLTGRKPLDSSKPRSEQSLVRWATPQLHDIDALARMVDPAMKGVYPAKSLSRFADVVALCVQPEPEFRPPMSEVVQSLVRLMQRASLTKRRSESEVGSRVDGNDPSDIV